MPKTPDQPAMATTRSNRQFVQTPVEILTDMTLTSSARDFASQLLRWDWGLGCSLTDIQLAEELECSPRTIQNHTKALVERGYLWCFEDREGMLVRLVRRPGGIHPRPKGLPAPISAKNFSDFRSPRKEVDFNNIKKLHDTTNYQQNPNSVPAEDPLAGRVVGIRTTEIRKLPDTPQAGTPSEHTPNPAIVKVMVDAGVEPFAALDLARKYPAIQCWNGVEYVERKLEHGETILNPGGYIRTAIENGWRKFTPVFRSKAVEKAAIDDSVEPSNQEQPEEKQTFFSDSLSLLDGARRNSPYAEVWEKAREIMRDPENLEAWVNPHTVSRFLDPCYVERMGDVTACLIAPGYAVTGVEACLEQVEEAVRLAGFGLELTAVREWEDSENSQSDPEQVRNNRLRCVQRRVILE